MSDGEFSVVQFFANDMHEYVLRGVGGEAAVRTFKAYSESVAARLGIVRRVIVTDGGDHTNCEWKYGEGYTYPPELVELQRKADERNQTAADPARDPH